MHFLDIHGILMGVVLEDKLFQVQKCPLVRHLLSDLHRCFPTMMGIRFGASTRSVNRRVFVVLVLWCVFLGGGGGDMSIPRTLLIGNNIFNLKLLLHDSALEGLR